MEVQRAWSVLQDPCDVGFVDIIDRGWCHLPLFPPIDSELIDPSTILCPSYFL
jgi:hypothetical protein